MPIPFSRLFGTSGRRAIEPIVPRRTFDDVILPPTTRRALDSALSLVCASSKVFFAISFPRELILNMITSTSNQAIPL